MGNLPFSFRDLRKEKLPLFIFGDSKMAKNENLSFSFLNLRNENENFPFFFIFEGSEMIKMKNLSFLLGIFGSEKGKTFFSFSKVPK